MDNDTRHGMPRAEAEAIYKGMGFEKIAAFPIEGLKSIWDKTKKVEHEIVHYARRDGLLLSVDYCEGKMDEQTLSCNWKPNDNDPTQNMKVLRGFNYGAWYLGEECSSVLEYGRSSGLKHVVESLEKEGMFKPLPSENISVEGFGTHEVDYDLQEQLGVDDFNKSIRKVDEVRKKRREAYPAWVTGTILQ